MTNPDVKSDLQTQANPLRGSVLSGTIFGGFVGLLIGPIIGAACSWLLGEFDFVVQGLLIGALAGPFGGLLIGFTERKARGDLAGPDVATCIGVAFGFVPALLILLQGLVAVRGRFYGFLLLGAATAVPMAGLVIGGILDRAFEEAHQKSWIKALTRAVVGIAICIGLVYLIDAAAYGPDPEEVSNEAKALIRTNWSRNPDTRDAKIQKVELTRKGRNAYEGFADVTFAGKADRLHLEVSLENGMLEVNWTKE